MVDRVEPFAIVTADEMRQLERAAIEAGAAESLLQERAGRAVAEEVARRVVIRGERVTVLAGAGNNGRDGVVAGRYLSAWGHPVDIWLGDRHGITPPELEGLTRRGLRARRIAIEGVGALRRALATSGVAIDGLLGIGIRGQPRGDTAEVIEALNGVRLGRPELLVVAVDVPSGVTADDGSVPGGAVRADLTVTFGAIKAGLLLFPGAHSVGDLIPRSIGIPPAATDGMPIHALDDWWISELRPPREIDAHKYRFGRVLVCAGSETYVGAAVLCSTAAARSGCGLVAVAASQTVKQVLATRLPEAVYPVTVDVEGVPEEAAEAIAAVLPLHQALLIGPGLGRGPAAGVFLRRLLAANASLETPVPMVIDADALSLLADWDDWPAHLGAPTILTPHGGEMSRLTGLATTGDAPPWRLAAQSAERWGQVVVLKGPFTCIAAPDERTWVYHRANPALATAGAGDVLAGLCAGFVAQGCRLPRAARLAVATHAVAGRLAGPSVGNRTLLASDLLAEIPRVLAGRM